MTTDFTNTRKLLADLHSRGIDYFAGINYCTDSISPFPELGSAFFTPTEADFYWSKLEESDQQTSMDLGSELMSVIGTIANCMKQSSLLAEADRTDLGVWTKGIRASLRLRRYRAWDTEVLHDEGMVLGVQPAGQSDDDPASPLAARQVFERHISHLFGLVDLLEASPAIQSDEFRTNPQVTAEYEPNSAFVMMQINSGMPELEDRYNTIKEGFAAFGIEAVRSDDIEHSDVITEKIMEKIRSSEFLFADLSGERPSVYYEIGFAHALKRRVIMYRSKGTNLHFDLAAYNCPEYSNLTDLKNKLIARLSSMTNKNPKNGSQ